MVHASNITVYNYRCNDVHWEVGLMYIWQIGFELLSANTQGYDIGKYTRNFLLCILHDKCICSQLSCWLETRHQQIEIQKNWPIFNLKFALTTKTNSCDHGWIVSECRCIIYISLPPFQLWRPCCCGTLHVSGSPDHRGVAQLLFRPREGEIGRRAVQIQLG